MKKWKYDGFISYSTRADADLAPKIQDGLERLAKPWTKRRALRVFQDIDDLAASGDLERTLRSELKQTNTLVFLASPESATSKWCDDELRYWIDERSDNELVVVLTGGTLDFDKDAERPIVAARSTAAPPAFASLESVPLFVDMRYDPDHVQRLDVRADPEFRLQLTKIAAVLHSNATGREIQPRDIDSRDLVEYRKARRARRLAAAALTLLTVVAVVFAGFAVYQRQIAIDERETAVRLGNEAQSRALAVSSQQMLDSDQQLALMLALEADDVAQTPQVSQAFDAAAASLWRATLPDDPSVSAVTINSDGTLVAAVESDGIVVWDVRTGASNEVPAGVLYTIDFDPTGSRLLTAGPEGVDIRSADGERLVIVTDQFSTSAEFTADGQYVLTVGDEVELWDLSSPTPMPQTLLADEDIGTASLDSSATRLLVTSSSGVFVHDLSGTDPSIEITDSMVSSARFGPDGSRAVTATNLNFGAFFGAFPDGVTVWPVDGGDPSTLTSVGTDDASFSPDGALIVSAGFEGATVWTPDGLHVADLPAGAIGTAAFSGDGSTMVTAGLDGVMVWQKPGTENLSLTGEPSDNASYSADGSRIVASGEFVNRNLPADLSVWDASGSFVAKVEPGPGSRSGFLSPDGSLIAYSDDFGVTVKGVDGDEESVLREFGITLGFSPDGTDVVVESDGLGLWNFADGQRSSLGPGTNADDVDFNADGTLVVTAGFDGVSVWDDSGNEIRRVTENTAYQVDLDPTETKVVTAGPDGVVVRNVSGEPNPVILTSRPVSAAAFNADGTRIATASDQGVVIWDLLGNARATVTTSANSVQFAPDGTTLLTAGSSGVQLWPIWTDQVIRPVLEQRVGGRTFSSEECVEFRIQSCPTVTSDP